MVSHSDLCIGSVFVNAARAVPERKAAVLGDESITFDPLEPTGEPGGGRAH
jgi:hypothetical protein